MSAYLAMLGQGVRWLRRQSGWPEVNQRIEQASGGSEEPPAVESGGPVPFPKSLPVSEPASEPVTPTMPEESSTPSPEPTLASPVVSGDATGRSDTIRKPRKTTISVHPKRREIRKKLVSGAVSMRDIAGQYGLSKSAVARESQRLPKAMMKAQRAAEVAEADSLLGRVTALKREAEAILQDARRSPGSQARRDALLAIDKALKAVELIGRIEGELRDGAQVHVTLFESPEWMSLQARVVAGLGPFPEARKAVLAALRGESIPVPTAARAAAVSNAPGAAIKADGEGTARTDREGPGSGWSPLRRAVEKG